MFIEAPTRRKNSILLTSLVDVMFVLLFFFMLASSYAEQRALPLNLGKAGAAAPGIDAAWTLQVAPDRRYALNGEALPLAEIVTRLGQARGQKLLLQAAEGVTLQELVTTLDALRPSGAALILARSAP